MGPLDIEEITVDIADWWKALRKGTAHHIIDFEGDLDDWKTHAQRNLPAFQIQSGIMMLEVPPKASIATVQQILQALNCSGEATIEFGIKVDEDRKGNQIQIHVLLVGENVK